MCFANFFLCLLILGIVIHGCIQTQRVEIGQNVNTTQPAPTPPPLNWAAFLDLLLPKK